MDDIFLVKECYCANDLDNPAVQLFVQDPVLSWPVWEKKGLQIATAAVGHDEAEMLLFIVKNVDNWDNVRMV
ncbi:hypothetical protein N7504_004229 [Penicillium tannophilum]|nr:hypothetical protein N7504_004229 [Penicillium tannophilum]